MTERKRTGSGKYRIRRGRKEPEKGKHLRNGCGKRIREGRKETNRKLSTGTGKECEGNRAGKNGENAGSESGKRALRKPLRGGDRKKGKEEQKAE